MVSDGATSVINLTGHFRKKQGIASWLVRWRDRCLIPTAIGRPGQYRRDSTAVTGGGGGGGGGWCPPPPSPFLEAIAALASMAPAAVLVT